VTARAELLDSTPQLGEPAVLRARFEEDGFVFFRGLVDATAVAAVGAEILSVLQAAGWLATSSPPADAVPGPTIHREGDDTWFDVYTRVQSLYSFHLLAHRAEIRRAVRALAGEDIFVHPRKIARVTFPGSCYPTPPHQDYRLIQGTADTYTVWLPLRDCPAAMGGLRLLPGSHRGGVRPAELGAGVGGVAIDVDPDDSRFRTTGYRAGDAVVFHSLTVHHAPANQGTRVRLSVDFRYQPVADPVVEASLRPHRHPLVPDHDVLTRGWPSLKPVSVPAGISVSGFRDPLGDLGPPPRSRHLGGRSVQPVALGGPERA
jgi:ectoine hydroxylase-related dioxygenase (phytanoyl-CoA dioxygenase family)